MHTFCRHAIITISVNNTDTKIKNMQEIEHEPSILDNEDYNAEIEEIEETPQEEFDREEFQIIKDNLN